MSEKEPRNADQNIEVNNSEIPGQIGQAGRDLIQIGRDYIQFIYKNSRSGNWGMVVIALLPLFLLLFGLKAGADKVVETFGAKSSTADFVSTPTPTTSLSTNPSPTPTTSSLTNPSPSAKDSTQPDTSQSNEFQFPQNSCGDKSTDPNSTWYPVFINGGNLDEIQQKYCKDAINATRQTGEKAIQVASFISDTKALKFAQAVGGEVGEPRKPNAAVSSPPPSDSGNKPSTPSSSNTAAAEEDARRRAAAEEDARRRAAAEEDARRRAAAETARRQAIAGCVVTINNSLVSLRSEPDTFSQELIRVGSGSYSVSDYVTRRFAGSTQGWFEITSGGRTGWVRNDTWTIEGKNSSCP